MDTDDSSLVGEAAHIVSGQPDGPRGDPSFPLERLDKYDNLILFCNVHHKQADDQVSHFTVDYLKRLKADHEKWVREALSTFDPVKQADDERWAAYIEEWALRCGLDHWYDETNALLQATPYVRKEFFDNLHAVIEWLLSRIWPDRYPELRQALESFRRVANDFVIVFGKHSTEKEGREFYFTERFYKIREWNPELYDLLGKRFDYHVDLVQDLTCEMTRAANYVCDLVRSAIDPSFRIGQGVLLVRRGVGTDLKERVYRLEYTPEERALLPYPGLEEFLQVRTSRDVSFGEGEDPTTG
ncbi:MAG TPA: hypothetical protein VMB85_23245 [Bryobacteraceae bacterium]|nr:hypothetical protein [Bryobacteraceae bacterium]